MTRNKLLIMTHHPSFFFFFFFFSFSRTNKKKVNYATLRPEPIIHAKMSHSPFKQRDGFKVKPSSYSIRTVCLFYQVIWCAEHKERFFCWRACNARPHLGAIIRSCRGAYHHALAFEAFQVARLFFFFIIPHQQERVTDVRGYRQRTYPSTVVAKRR